MKADSAADIAGEKDTGRIEAFSDGVFSIAMTLLVLELKVPDFSSTPGGPTAPGVWAALLKQWPSYFAFVTSFFTVLIMWINHHGIFRLIRRSSSQVIITNGVLLFLVTAVPFPTALIAAYLRTPAASVACTVYGGLFVLISLAYAALLMAAGARNGHLLVANALPSIRKRTRDCYLVGFPLYLLAALTAPFTPLVSMGICTVLWLYWAVNGAKYSSEFCM